MDSGSLENRMYFYSCERSQWRLFVAKIVSRAEEVSTCGAC